jgi:hypothetical protein
MFRITILVLAGAFIAGCQEGDLQGLTAHHGGVQGDKDYYADVQGNSTVRDHTVYGDRKYSDSARTASVRSETVTNTPNTPAEARTSADVRAPADVRADLQKSADARATADARTPDNANASGKADPERMAFASTARFPSDMRASEDLRATAMIGRDGIKIANATDQEIKDAKLWVDGTYVTQVNSIPAHSVVTVKRTELSDRSGNLPTDLQGVKQLQLETHANLYNLQGPVFENR